MYRILTGRPDTLDKKFIFENYLFSKRPHIYGSRDQTEKFGHGTVFSSVRVAGITAVTLFGDPEN